MSAFKLFIKAFLVYGIFFGATMSGWEIFNGGEFNLLMLFMFILQGGLFGLLMAAWTTLLQVRQVKKLGVVNPTDRNFRPNQSLTIETSLTLTEIENIIRQHSETRKWNVTISGESLTAKTGTNWRSWGEVVTVQNSDSGIMVNSRPTLSTTLFDYGKNLANVQLVKQVVEEERNTSC